MAKVTFYRHFPGKNDLVLALLAHRHGNTPHALVPTLAEWFAQPTFRGCAFINNVGELGDSLPPVRELTRSHKADMTRHIERLLPPTNTQDAQAQALAVDGAIISAQCDDTPHAALQGAQTVLGCLTLNNRQQKS